MARFAAIFLACAHTFVCASYPLWLVVGSNSGVLPPNVPVVARSAAVVFAVMAFLLWALRPLSRDLATRAMWLSTTFLMFSMYALVAALAGGFGFPIDTGSPAPAALHVFACLAVASLVIRPWKMRHINPLPLNVLALLLLAVNLYPSVKAAATKGRVAKEPADMLVKGASPRGAARAPVDRDIYYIVLDGFGRADVLKDHYGVDLASFVAFLESKGFYVPERSQSNYAQTFLSLASTLNMSYLDELSVQMEKGSRDRRPLHDLIQRNALMNLARRAGYRVVGIGSNYAATERLAAADVCVCEQRGLHDLEQTALGLTPLAALPLDRWTYDAHRQKVLDAFTALERSAAMPDRKLVFAHILSPHPPFVFGPNGQPRRGAAPFGLYDGDHFRGSRAEYASGYRDQVRFVTARTAAIVETLLSRPGPPPAIVLHGDHGPGSMLRWNDPQATNMRERMGTFSAYYFPGANQPPFSAAMTPVNGARALASQYLGVDLPTLPDKSFFSTWERPYDLVAVRPAEERVGSPSLPATALR
jgi:hypothetical protein